MYAAQLQHGQLEHADGNGDWVLTIFKALSLVSIFFYRFFCGILVNKLKFIHSSFSGSL